jgi:hypothetical protein
MRVVSHSFHVRELSFVYQWIARRIVEGALHPRFACLVVVIQATVLVSNVEERNTTSLLYHGVSSCGHLLLRYCTMIAIPGPPPAQRASQLWQQPPRRHTTKQLAGEGGSREAGRRAAQSAERRVSRRRQIVPPSARGSRIADRCCRSAAAAGESAGRGGTTSSTYPIGGVLPRPLSIARTCPPSCAMATSATATLLGRFFALLLVIAAGPHISH